jgi:hypothetical protein
MMAFWLLAAVAAVITGLGLNAGGASVAVRAGSPSPVTNSGTPELELGGLLRALPSAAAEVSARVDTWGSAVASQDPTAPGVDDASARATVAGPRVTVPTDSSAVARARANASATATPAPGKGHDEDGPGSGPGSTPSATAPATPSGKPTDLPNGNGNGNGGNGSENGQPQTDPGKGAGH